MSFDLLVKGGTLPDGTVADIGIKGEVIAAIEPRIDAEAGRVEVIGHGRLVIRSICAAVDAYFDAQQGRHAKAL